MKTEQQPIAITYLDYLHFIGEKLGCYFTLEYRAYQITRQPSSLQAEMTNDQSIATMPALLAKLRDGLTGFSVIENPKNPKVIHIIEQALEQADGYVLNKRTSVQYAGHLVPCVVKDTNGRNLQQGAGVVVALARTVGKLENGTAEARGDFDDCNTKVKIDAKNESVRNILTDCIPLKNYHRILWRAAATERNGKPTVMIQFYGPKQ